MINLLLNSQRVVRNLSVCKLSLKTMSLRVETLNGPVIGVRATSILGDEYIGFYQIPYAKPPIRNLRFKDPEPIDNWTVPIQAARCGFACCGYSARAKMIIGNENCLHINIFTKNLPPTIPKPVMVWIYGGGFIRGSSSQKKYGPDYLIAEDIILVTFNYRVGALGFLMIDDPKYKIFGNAGLKDQCLALKWIKANIERFGGDSQNITLFGQSAGSVSVNYHMVSPMSEGLFHKAILMSGTVFNSWAIVPDKKWAQRLAVALGWNKRNSVNSMVKFLQSSDPMKIVEVQNGILTKYARKCGIFFPFGPMIEPFASEQCFLSDDPKVLHRTAWGNKIPIIIGGTSEEGLVIYTGMNKKPQIPDEKTYYVPTDINYTKDKKKIMEHAKKLQRAYYLPNVSPAESYIKLFGDKLFWHGVHRALLSRLNDSNSNKTYLYRFNFNSKVLSSKGINNRKSHNGTSHADDLPFIFRNNDVKQLNMNSREYQTIKTMVGYFTNFAKTGNPNSSEISETEWHHLKSAQPPFQCLNISDYVSFMDLPEAKRMEIWDSLYNTDELY